MAKRTILVIEDEKINRLICEKIMHTQEWIEQVYWANNGMEAMDTLEDYCKGLIKMPDMILLDLHMPLMNGVQFMEAFREMECLKGKQERMVVAVVSSSINPADYDRVHKLGVAHFIDKPLTIEKFSIMANEAFGISINK